MTAIYTLAQKIAGFHLGLCTASLLTQCKLKEYRPVCGFE